MPDPVPTPAAGPMPAGQVPPNGPVPNMAAPDINSPMPGQGMPGSTPQPQAQSTQVGNGAQPAPPPGSMFSHLSHAFMGAVLGTLAGKEQTTGYTTDETGKLSPVTKQLTPRDQIARIAKGALSGLAAAGQYGIAAPAVQQAKARIHTQQQKEEAIGQFETEQKAKFNQLNNTHIMLQTLAARKDLANADLQSNQSMAGLGNDIMQAAVSGGNQIVGKANMDSSEAAQFRKDNPDYLKYTPLITRATLETDPEGNPVVDPKTGVQKVQRSYTFVDLQRPINLTQSMIDHLKTINYPGAERLTPDTAVDPLQFQSLYWNGLKAYNEANSDAKNKELTESTDKEGNPVKFLVNKVTGVVTPLTDPDTKQPLGGAIKTETHTIFNPATQKNEDYIVNTRTGKKIALVGENRSDMNSVANAVGDFSKTGEAYLATVPPSMRMTIKSLAHYDMQPADLGRSGNRLQILEAAGQYNGSPLNEQLYKLRFNYMNDYQDPKTGDGKQRASANTAIGHLDQLSQAGDALDTGDIRALNAIALRLGLETGSSAPAIYDAIAYKAAAEAATAAQGGIPNQAETDKLYDQFNSKAAPQQRNGVIKAQYGLIVTPMQNMRTRFTENMGQTPESLGRPVLNANNEAILQKYGFANSPVVAPAGAVGGMPNVPLSNLHTNGNVTIGWDGKQWVDATTRVPYLPPAPPNNQEQGAK